MQRCTKVWVFKQKTFADLDVPDLCAEVHEGLGFRAKDFRGP